MSAFHLWLWIPEDTVRDKNLVDLGYAITIFLLVARIYYSATWVGERIICDVFVVWQLFKILDETIGNPLDAYMNSYLSFGIINLIILKQRLKRTWNKGKDIQQQPLVEDQLPERGTASSN